MTLQAGGILLGDCAASHNWYCGGATHLVKVRVAIAEQSHRQHSNSQTALPSSAEGGKHTCDGDGCETLSKQQRSWRGDGPAAGPAGIRSRSQQQRQVASGGSQEHVLIPFWQAFGFRLDEIIEDSLIPGCFKVSGAYCGMPGLQGQGRYSIGCQDVCQQQRQ